MKILKRDISAKNGEGMVVMLPEEPEDLWHAYNLVCAGDRVTTTTYRKVIKEGSTGSVSAQRVRTNITLEVLSVDFNAQDCNVRISGRNVEENEYVKMGAHHTVELEVQRKFTLHKDCWDTIFLERLSLCSDVTKKASLAAVVMHPGFALVCLITSHMTVVRAKIEQAVPKKRRGNSGHDTGLKKFFNAVLQAMLRHVDFEIVKAVVLASPGYLKDDFYAFVMEDAVRHDRKELITNKSRFLLCHSSSGHKHALQEVLAQESVQKQLADTQAAAETQALERFCEMLQTEPDRAYYGFNHVLRANEANAIEALLVTDDLFRSADLKTRKAYVALVDDCKDKASKVYLFSTLHVSGEQLKQFSGVAAILRFPLPDLEALDEDSEDDSDDESDAGAKQGNEHDDAMDSMFN